MNSNLIVNVDTDSIMIVKPDQTPWSKEEQQRFLDSLNSQYPDLIRFDHDGVYTSVIVLASKNYALLPEGSDKLKIKGSGLKDQKKEPALKEMLDRFVKVMLKEDQSVIQDMCLSIYNEYVKEALNVTDISRWSQKKNASEAVLKCKGYEKYTKEQLEKKEIRPNETNIWDAIKNEELVQPGDRFYLYPAILEKTIQTTEKVLKSGKVKVTEKEHIKYGLKQVKYWTKDDHDVEQLLKRIHDTVKIFKTVLDINLFIDYSKSKNKELLNEFRYKSY